MKKKISFFIAYAHKNNRLAADLCERLKDHFQASKNFECTTWRDVDLLPGEEWDARIRASIDQCDCGILLVSVPFLISNYIKNVELPSLMRPDKVIIPVGLRKIDFDHHDLHGLEKLQIYRYAKPDSAKLHFFSELDDEGREDFVLDLFIQIENRLLTD